jgi:hypothetical protein
MSHTKQASTQRKRSINAVPVLSAAGLSLSPSKRSVCCNRRACSGCADAENRNKPRNHSL